MNNVFSTKDEWGSDVAYEKAARKIEASVGEESRNLLNQTVRKGYSRAATIGINNKRLPQPSTAGSLNPMASTASADFFADRPTTRYENLGGIDSVLQDVRELIEYPLMHPEVYEHLGIEPPRGTLLHGPPGCGKTLLANAIAGELGVPFFRVSAPEIVSGMSGESEQKVRDLFESSLVNSPCIIFIDEVDAITSKREASSRGMEKRIVAQLLTCMDSLSAHNATHGGSPVAVIGATNRPNDLDPALRRAGRFDREICLGVPDQESRVRILSVMCSRMRLSGDFDFSVIAKRTPGFVGADLSALSKEAAVIAINRIFPKLRGREGDKLGKPDGNDSTDNTMKVDNLKGSMANLKDSVDNLKDSVDNLKDSVDNSKDSEQEPEIEPSSSCDKMSSVMGKVNANEIEGGSVEAQRKPWKGLNSIHPLSNSELLPLCITMEDFLLAVKKVQPSAKREGFATTPDVTWSDVGALSSVREELTLSVLEPISSPERFHALGLSLPAGLLLYGPPGCGKTLLAKAAASESGANFICVKGPELLDKYVGESERAVRQVFQRARSSSPCIIFFDELDSLCPRRGNGGEGGGGASSGVSERVVNQLLTEMDGLDSRRGVYVIAATNRPELIDPAMLRPGRLDKVIYVPLPSMNDRISILKTLCRPVRLAKDVNLNEIGADPRTEGFSGADLSALVREAGLDVIRQIRNKEIDSILVTTEPCTSDIDCFVSRTNFHRAIGRVKPSVSTQDEEYFVGLPGRLRCKRAHNSEAL